MEARYLYLMLSQTSTGMGRLIRLCTGYEFNHVSLSLDPELRRWVSFARYAVDVPLAGGFVVETPERFCPEGQGVPVRIYRIALTEERFQKLRQIFLLAGRRDSGLIYNSFSALFTVFGRKCRIPGAYTCLDFACKVLAEDYASIHELDDGIRAEVYYEGDLSALIPDSGSREDPYFHRRGLLRGTWDTAGHFTRLCSRWFRGPVWDLIDSGLTKKV